MSNNADQPAYPVIKTDQEQTSYNQENYVYGKTYSTGGLSKRELIAAMAMQGILSNPAVLVKANPLTIAGEVNIAAIEHADTILSQLEKDKL